MWRLTRPAAAPVVPAPTPAAPTPGGETALEVRVSFAPAPEEFRLSYLGNAVLAGRGPRAEFTGTWRVALPPEGADLALEARFSAPSPAPAAATPGSARPAAVRVRCRFPDGHVTERTVWADAERPLVELVTVTP